MRRTVRRRPPHAVRPGWWVVCGNVGSDELVALRRVTVRPRRGRLGRRVDRRARAQLAGRATVTLSVTAPSAPGRYSFAVLLMSDVYLGLDQQLNVTVLVE